MIHMGKLRTSGLCKSLCSLHDKVRRDIVPYQLNNVLGISFPSLRVSSKARGLFTVANMIKLPKKFTSFFLKLFLLW